MIVTAASQQPGGLLDVALELLGEGVDALELLLAAQAAHEPDPGRLVVEVAAEADQVGLDQRPLGVLVEGRALADVDRRRVARRRPAARTRRRRRRRRASGGRPDRHVGRREADLAAPAVADGDRAPHLEGPAEERVRRLDVAGGEQRHADGGRARSTSPSPVICSTSCDPTPRSRARAPMRSRSATLPRRWWPKWKSAPTTTARTRRPSTSTSRTKSSAGSCARSSSKCTTSV